MSAIHDVVTRTDWALLKEQKLTLLKMSDNLRTVRRALMPELEADPERRVNLEKAARYYEHNEVVLDGILNWMDEIQDAAEKDGCPVQWLTEGDDE